jgi:exopolyphosphatase/guanosine-5'-triphosphate,3'-diphosphate pyrophosphatase
MLLADMQPEVPRTEAARTIGTRIGEGLRERGELREDAMARTLDALSELKSEINGHYDRLVTIATSALRRAKNGDAFAGRLQAITGVPLRILSGEEEAAASFRGAVGSLGDSAASHGVVDVGGGSTEYALGSGCLPELARSYEIGAVRLTERFPKLAGNAGVVDAASRDGAYEEARTILEPMRALPRAERIACVGGSATTTLAILGGGTATASEFVREDLRELFERLCDTVLEARKRLPGMRPQRADILPAGIIVLDAALESTGHDRAVVAPGDLLLGTLLQERERVSADEAI